VDKWTLDDAGMVLCIALHGN